MQTEYTEAINELMTVRDVLRWGISQFNQSEIFYGHGTDNAWDEALQLVLYSLHLPLDVDKELLDCRLTHIERRQIISMFEQRIVSRVPAAYLTHHAWFAGLEFYVDERVLIPRSPLAEVIESHFEPWLAAGDIETVLDLCCGSACIAIAVAKHLPHAQVDAIDLSGQAIEVAAINVKHHEVQSQVSLIQSDLLLDVPPKKYDVIISNPPYVDAEDMASLPAEYLHEPGIGLTAGQDGLQIVDRLLRQASDYLSEDGILLVEVGNTQLALTEKYPQVPFMWLEFTRGGDGVFLLTAQQVKQYFGENDGRE